MIQQETKECITAAILAESMRAERIHGLYHSSHEGYAVLMEEIEEAQEILEKIKEDASILWDVIRQDGNGMELAFSIYLRAIDCCGEMVQIGAVVGKYCRSMQKQKDPEEPEEFSENERMLMARFLGRSYT